MGKQIKNQTASILRRLLNFAKQHQIDFNRILLIYFQQCFLKRLSLSEYKNQLIMKGGLLFSVELNTSSRPTKDMDFLGHRISNQPEKILDVIKEIIQIELEDGVIFDRENLNSEIISEQNSYNGVRIFVPVFLGRATTRLQIDIGFGDIVILEPVNSSIPVLLTNDTIEIMAYSWESVIAEKFEAIVSFGDLNSRMKDYYDIYYIINHVEIDGTHLKEALEETFSRRRTDFGHIEYIFSESFIRNKNKMSQWNAFLRKVGEETHPDFSEVMSAIVKFLLPVISSIQENTEFKKLWNWQEKKWH
ncbi:MAG: nucleotidyl transferase AbiEii/AbiGii toxin family protein [Marinilabiliales bacterium]